MQLFYKCFNRNVPLYYFCKSAHTYNKCPFTYFFLLLYVKLKATNETADAYSNLTMNATMMGKLTTLKASS